MFASYCSDSVVKVFFNMSKRKFVELTIEKKKQVLDHLSNGESCRKLAEEYGISKSTVSNINNNRTAIINAWEKIVVS